ncbi:MAG: ABC transporter ATP-binding protein [Clostridia bacterium]|nr:ABC transporter ATP-binding protein [Clostridia bacterium]
MGPGRFGPPPSEMNEKLKEPLPKKISEIPGYIKRVSKSFFSRLGYIIRLVWEAKRSLLILMIFMALFNGISPVISAYISANLLNRVAEALTLDSPVFESVVAILLPAMLLQFGYMFFVSLVNNVSNMITRISSEVVTNHVKCKIMNKAKEIDVASFDMPEFYEKFENANREAGTRPIHVIQATFNIVSTGISAISFIAILAAIAWFAPLVVVLLSLPSAIITFSYRKKNFRYMRHHSKERRQMSYYSDMLVNKDMVKELRLFGLSDTFIFNYNKVFARYFKGIKGLITGEGIWSIAISFVTTTVNCALFFFIAYTVTNQGGQIGDYSLYTGALTSIASCVASLVSTTSSIYEGTLFIDNMIVFMNEKRHITPTLPEPRSIERHIGHTIEFKNVSFRYPGTERDVLKNVSFVIDPGDTVVLVGLNGAGKTTLLKLLTRLYDPTDGVILLDGHDIREYDTAELYDMFGVIFQDFGKYAFTVNENIAFGEVTKPMDHGEIVASAEAASADEFIRHLPNGYETSLMRVFERDGIEPSIGQWQKLAIARAFYSDSDVLILDEPTASLDAIAEQEIFNQFDRLREDKTTFFVSHRLSSATIATKILVLQNGCLVEMGNHAALMQKKGIYYELFTTQANRYLAEANERAEAQIPPHDAPPPHGPFPSKGPRPPRAMEN